MAVFRCCSCGGGHKVSWIINSSAIFFTWVSIVSKFFIGEVCYHDNEVQPVLPSLLLVSSLSQLFLVAVAISLAVDSYRNYANGITIFIFLLNLVLILLGIIFVLKGWNSPQTEPANIIPFPAPPSPAPTNESDSLRNVSVERLAYSVSVTTFPATKASTKLSVPEKRDFRSYKKSCRDLILMCATVVFPVDGLLTVSLIFLFIFSNKINGTQDISEGLQDDEIPLLESIENSTKRILKEE